MTSRDAWANAVTNRPGVSTALGELVPAVCDAIDRRPANVTAVKGALDALLTFLASPEGRTTANCEAVDRFFSVSEEYGWDGAWDHLPDQVQDVLADMAGALHDTISTPNVAENFESTPEQLLARLRAVRV